MKASVISLALSLLTATVTLGQSSPSPYAERDLRVVRHSLTNPAKDQPKFAYAAHSKANFAPTNPENGTVKPTNVVLTKTVNAAIYRVINSVKVKLAVENPMQTSLRVRLLGEHGEVLYAKPLPRGRKVSMLCFDMERMQDGTYTVEVSDGVNHWPLEFQLHSPNPVVPQRVIALN